MRIKEIFKNQSGSMLIIVLTLMGLFFAILMGAIDVSLLQGKLNQRKAARAQALHIAEAGVNYYRWVLYHERNEYCNNAPCVGAPDYGPYGPYEYSDAGEDTAGYYELYITPPAKNGSTEVTIRSVGWVSGFPSIRRSVEVRCGIPSWTTYATLTNGADDNLSYGATAEVWGPIHSNYGCVEFDGIAHNLITSSQPGCTNIFGVRTCRNINPYRGTGGCDPAWDGNDPPLNLPDPERPNFLGGRDMGSHIPVLSFADAVGGEYMRSIYAKATSSDGLLFDPANAGTADPYSQAAFQGCQSAGTCANGFHITLKAGDKFDMRGVITMRAAPIANSRSVNTQSAAVEYDIPDNGIVFVKHHVWVDGHVDNGASGTRLTILAFKNPIDGDNDAEIRITNDITYSEYDGRDAIGLIAQKNVAIGYYTENDLRIDAALLAKSGSRFCEDTSITNNSLTIYGNTASFLKPYVSACFTNRYYIYDNSLTYAPPPHYPSTGQYTFISWREE